MDLNSPYASVEQAHELPFATLFLLLIGGSLNKKIDDFIKVVK